MAKKARTGPSKAQLLKEHGDLYRDKLEGKASDRELTEHAQQLMGEGIPFEKIVAVRQKVLDRFRGGIVGVK